MSDAPHTRTCPQCARLVPARISVCRCGYTWPASGEASGARASVDDGSSGSDSSSRGRLILWSLLLTAPVVIVGIVVLMREPQRPNPRTVAVPPSQVSATQSPVPAPGQPVLPGFTTAPPAAYGGPAAAPAPSAPSASPTSPGASAPSSLADLVSRAAPAVVTIESGVGLGTGFFVSPTQVVTNHHVVQQSTTVTLRLYGGQQARGRVVARSLEADLALVQSETALGEHPALLLRSIGGVRPGEEVLAIGSPALGRSALESSVTRGIISGIRSLEGVTVIQTDAALNPGNSGGPLVDMAGRVVGINSVKAAGQESIGFAVAADYAQALLEGRPIRTSSDASRPAVWAQPTPIPAPSAAPSQAELQRDAGAQALEEQLKALAQEAARYARGVEQYRDACLTQLRAQPWQTVDRYITSDSAAHPPDCRAYRLDLLRFKNDIKDALKQVVEQARRAGVYPGAIRSLREKYDLAGEVWER